MEMIFWIFCALMAAQLLGNGAAITDFQFEISNINWQNGSIFNVPYCTLRCGDRSHTLCDRFGQKEISPNCKAYEPLTLNSEGLPKFKESLIEGHNGIRNRVASKMKITHMLELTWDLELERMAENYLRFCLPFWDDNCAISDERFDPFDVFSFLFVHDENSMYRISQNRYFYKGAHLPVEFVEWALATWYAEKNLMKAPTLRRYGHLTFYRFFGKNNFTHLIYPWSYRFGCSMARMFGGYAITCYYYPFHEPEGSVFYFIRGTPTNLCPPKFPIANPHFSNLCSNVFRVEGSDRLQFDRLLAVFPLLNILFTFY